MSIKLHKSAIFRNKACRKDYNLLVLFNAYSNPVSNAWVSDSTPLHIYTHPIQPNILPLESLKSLWICLSKLEEGWSYCSEVTPKFLPHRSLWKWIWLDKGRQSGLKFCLQTTLHKNKTMSTDYQKIGRLWWETVKIIISAALQSYLPHVYP